MSVTIENRALPNFDPILLIVCFRVSLKIDTLKKDECQSFSVPKTEPSDMIFLAVAVTLPSKLLYHGLSPAVDKKKIKQTLTFPCRRNECYR